MDIWFICRNYSGLAIARVVERFPCLLPWLRSSRSVFKPHIAARLRGSKVNQRRTIEFDGLTMDLDLRDDVQRMIYLDSYEREDVLAVARLIQPGSLCIDVGANVGWFTLWMAKALQGRGKVIAIEADSRNVEQLKRNIHLSDLDDVVEVIHAAASDTMTDVTFNRSHVEHSGWGSVLPLPDNTGFGQVSIKAVTLDQLICDSGYESVSLLKVDVEGYESVVFRGARKCLDRRLFDNVFFEYAGRLQSAAGHRIEDFAATMTRAGLVPSPSTAMLIDDVKSKLIEESNVFANLLFSRG